MALSTNIRSRISYLAYAIMLIVVSLLVLIISTVKLYSDVKKLDEKAVVIGDSRYYLSQLRRNEKDLFARNKVKYYDDFEATLKILTSKIELLKVSEHHEILSFSDELNRLSSNLTSYRNLFTKIKDSKVDIGLDENSGLRGKLRASVHKVEDIQGLEASHVIKDMLMLRRNEKDFMLRKQTKYVDIFISNYELFKNNLERSDLHPSKKELILYHMKDYTSDFLRLIDIYKVIGLSESNGLRASMLQYVRRVESISDNLHTRFLSLVTSLRNKTISIIISLWVAIMIFIISLLIMMYFLIKKFIADEINYLVDTAQYDKLTKCFNRTVLDELLEKQKQKCELFGSCCSILLIDIDHFKAINDQYGHNVGDTVLTEVVTVLRECIRKSDFLGRWGGEEFLVICPDTDKLGMLKIAEKMRESINDFEYSKVGRKTASFGIAEFEKGLSAHEVVNNADKALYKAKDGGRNRIC